MIICRVSNLFLLMEDIYQCYRLVLSQSNTLDYLRWSTASSILKEETFSAAESYHTCSDASSPEQTMNVNCFAGNDYEVNFYYRPQTKFGAR